MIEVDCPQCGKHLRIKDKYAGQRGTCKGCGGVIHVPAAPEVIEPRESQVIPSQPYWQEPPTVQFERKKTGQSLGIGSIILGFVGLPFTFVPIIGLISIPLIGIGMLLGIVGWIAAMRSKGSGVGYSIAGVVLNGVAGCVIALWLVATVGTFSAVSTAAERASLSVEETSQPAPEYQDRTTGISPSPSGDEAEAGPNRTKFYTENFLTVENFVVGEGRQYSFADTEPGLFGTLVNTGPSNVSSVEITFYFFDEEKVISELAKWVHNAERIIDPDPILRPNYRHDFGFSIEDDKPSGWSGYVEYQITDVDFE